MDLEAPSYRLLDSEKTAEIQKFFKGTITNWVQLGDKNWLFPHKYKEEGNEFLRFKAKPSDIWTVSYPRSGKICLIIFLLTIVWEIITKIFNVLLIMKKGVNRPVA